MIRQTISMVLKIIVRRAVLYVEISESLHAISVLLDDTQDYCQFETFNPQCWQSEVIVVRQAFYGRRHASRCTESEGDEFARNPRYFGCSADVTATLHARCSGRKQCKVRIPDPELESTGACVVGLRMFLEATYYCVEGNMHSGTQRHALQSI